MKIIYIIMLCHMFQECKSQNVKNNHFIYHSVDYYPGNISKERIYNSSTGIYEYKESTGKKVLKNIKIFLTLNSGDLEDINTLHSSSESEISDCYFENNMLIHKSTITFNAQKDNFNLIECNKNENSVFVKIENKIEKHITSSQIYKTTFYWEFYKK